MSAEVVSAALRAALDAGVREFVVCAGARNSGPVVALASAPAPVRVWRHFEERSAAFFALGRILAGAGPVAVVTTSGTAAAELLPAAVEAHYQGLPLLLITADRPESYRGTGAPQAIEQDGIFGVYSLPALDAPREHPAGLSAWEKRGAAHLNVRLEEPRAADLPGLRAVGAALTVSSDSSGNVPACSSCEVAIPVLEPLILLGDLRPEERPAVLALCLRLGAPVYAEAASGLREHPEFSPLLLKGGDTALRHAPHRSVLRLGGVPACRFWRDLESRPEVPVISFSRTGHRGLARDSAVYPLRPECLEAVSAALTPAYSSAWAGEALEEALAAWPGSEPAVFRALSRVVPPGAAVFTGNSLPIREWNLCADPSGPLPAAALRGANGIDGNLSAFLGYAADAEEAWAVTGDLTTLYDLTAPWLLEQIATSRIRIVAIQNHGGRIFSRLPQLDGLTDAERALMENPRTVPLEGWARMWGMECLTLHAPLTFPENLPDKVVLEVFPDAEQTEGFWRQWRRASP